MQPEEPKQPDSSSYEFILKTEEPEAPPLASRFNKKRLIILLIILASFVIAFLITLSTLQNRANNAQRERLVEIAQMQTEISRIASIGADQAEDEANRVRAQAIKDSMEDSLGETKSLLEARKGKIDDELLAANKNEQIDEQLNNSTEFKSFDKAFNKVIDVNVLDYQKALILAEKAGNSKEKAALQAAYKEANSILGLVDEQ